MKRVHWILLLVALAAGGGALCVLLPGGDGGDEYPDPPFLVVGKESPRAETNDLVRDIDERAACDAAAQERYVDALTIAATLLERDPDGAAALYAMARVEAFGDGNLPRGLHFIRRLRHKMEKKGRDDPQDVVSREWYLRALETEGSILSEFDRREDELRSIEVLEKATAEPMHWQRIWPLIKLARFDDARAEATATLEQFPVRGVWQRERALNGRCATEFQARARVPCYEAAKRMVEEFPTSAVLAANLGEASRVVFRFDEAEEADTRATKAQQDFHGTAYHYLAQLQIQQGRFADALESLIQGKRQRLQRDPYTLQQDEAKAIRSSAILFLLLGRAEQALETARRACELPDRAGATSEDKDIGEIEVWLTRRAAVLCRREELREQAGAREGWRKFSPDPEAVALAIEDLEAERRLLRLLQGERLQEEIRPYLLGNNSPPSWLMGTFVGVLPPAVARRVLQEARAAEDHPGAVPYFDAIEAEVALAVGDDEEALGLARKAREALPAVAEKLLRGRLAAVAGTAARRLGRSRDGMDLLGKALGDFPGAFRLLGVPIPVRWECDDAEPARRVTDALRKSTRLERDPNGFAVSVRLDGDRIAIRMDRGGDRARLEAFIPVNEGENLVKACLERFHEVLASGGIELSKERLARLEGAPLPSSAGRAEDH